MVTPVNIPRLGIAMTEGTISEWLVEDGAEVGPGTPIYILETDKVDNEIEATAAGVLRIKAAAGETYEVGAEIAEIEAA